MPLQVNSNLAKMGKEFRNADFSPNPNVGSDCPGAAIGLCPGLDGFKFVGVNSAQSSGFLHQY
jgi:hypothetical protein